VSLRHRLERHAGLVFLTFVLVLLAGAELFVRLALDVRNVGPSFSEFHPRFVRALKPGVSLERKTPEFRMRLTTNSLGMRGEEPRRKPEPWRDLLFLGDSFTMGYPVRVGNAGGGNSGTARLLRYLEENPHGLAPDLTIYQFCENDFQDNLGEGLYRLDADGGLVALPPPPGPRALRAVQAWVDRVPLLSDSHLFCLVREAIPAGAFSRPSVDAVPGRAGDGGEELTFALVRRLLLRLRALGSEVVAVSFDVEGERRRRLEALLGELGVPHVRLASKAERPDLYFRIDAHWNAAGHRYAADTLTPRVASALLAGENEG
jgi:hypothetical protein